MQIIKPIIFGSLILAALSATQMDAFARFEHRGHGGGDFAAAEDRAREIPRDDDSKVTVL